MTLSLRFIGFISFFLCAWTQCAGQEPVAWQFSIALENRDEAVITIIAGIAPGWHLYSQFLGEGGPMPTQFIFEQTDHFMLVGGTKEEGKAVKFHDDIYEMDVTWYTGVVNFLQRIRLDEPGITIKGRVEYMVCNDHICVPGKRDFSIVVKPK